MELQGMMEEDNDLREERGCRCGLGEEMEREMGP